MKTKTEIIVQRKDHLRAKTMFKLIHIFWFVDFKDEQWRVETSELEKWPDVPAILRWSYQIPVFYFQSRVFAISKSGFQTTNHHKYYCSLLTKCVPKKLDILFWLNWGPERFKFGVYLKNQRLFNTLQMARKRRILLLWKLQHL